MAYLQRALISIETPSRLDRYCDAISRAACDVAGFFTKSSTASRMSGFRCADVMTGVECEVSEGWLPLH